MTDTQALIGVLAVLALARPARLRLIGGSQ